MPSAAMDKIIDFVFRLEPRRQVAKPVSKMVTTEPVSPDPFKDLDLEVVKADMAILRPTLTYTITCLRADIHSPDPDGVYRRFLLDFDNGSQWHLIIRHDKTADGQVIDPELHWLSVKREVATLAAMFTGRVPYVPSAWISPFRKSVTPEYPSAHFYRDVMDGRAIGLSHCTLNKGITRMAEARNFMKSYVMYKIALSQSPFEAAGQLLRDRYGAIYVGPIGGFPVGSSRTIGPFTNWADRVNGLASLALEEKLAEGADIKLENYLAFLDATRIIASNPTFTKTRSEFYLRNPNETEFDFMTAKGDLTALVDWEHAYTTTKEEAFMAPPCFWNPTEQRGGSVPSLSADELLLIDVYIEYGRHDLATCVRNGPIYRMMYPGSGRNFSSGPAISRFRRGLGGDCPGLTYPASKDDWIEECLELYKDDRLLQLILGKEYKAEKEAREREEKALAAVVATLPPPVRRQTWAQWLWS